MRDPIRVACEHEAAHAICADVLGVKVVRLVVNRDGSGYTDRAFAAPDVSATISAAGDLWDRELSAHEYRYNACRDLRRAVDQVGTAGIWQARADARDILTRHRADVLRLAGRLYRERDLTFL